VFAEVLVEFAQRSGEARLAPIVARLTAPLRIAVQGRDGVGRARVGRAVAGPDRRIVEAGAEVAMVVVAEALKPEDAAALTGWRMAGVPALLVRTKADLGGAAAGVGAAGVPVVACAALLAEVELDDELVAGLRGLAAGGADLRSADAFLHAAPPGDVAPRLLRTLDRSGIALCVRALQRGADPAELPAVLRRASGIDAVLGGLDTVAAPVRYRRVRAALAELQAVAVGNDAVGEFLAGDDVVLAVMTAAVDVLQGAGISVDRGDSEAAHLSRAVWWRGYGRRAPVNALHRSCAADVCRGSLRLLGRRP
jgi:hypothetical protein